MQNEMNQMTDDELFSHLVGKFMSLGYHQAIQSGIESRFKGSLGIITRL